MVARSQTGLGMKAVAIFFAGLSAAKPMYNKQHLAPRQDVAATTPATPTPDPAVTDAPTLDGAVVQAAAVSVVVSGTERKCSIDSVTAFTTTAFMTLPTTTEPLYTITLKPTLGCTCDDGWMAGIGTSTGTDGMATVTCQFGDDVNPAVATQSAGIMIPSPNFVDEWCQTIDTNDPNKLIDLWENKNVSAVLDKYTRGKEEGWLRALVEQALPNKGDVGDGGCGVIGGSCDFTLDCKSMVEGSLAAEYWILKAVEGFHAKLQVAHEFLQDTAIDNILSLDTIASDFSKPKDTGINALDILAPLLSAGIFLGGSVTGIVGVAAAEAGLAAKAARAAAEAGARRALAGNNVKQTNRLDGIAATAAKQESVAGGVSRTANALGAGLWTTASTFTMIAAFTDPEGQVQASDLSSTLQRMFSAARDQIKALGNRAMGRGGDYDALPASNGSGYGITLAPDSYTAGFFSDGKFLLSESNPTFNQSIQDSYGTFKSKIVDQALQTGGLQVFALTDLNNEGECSDESLWGGYGAQWMDPGVDGQSYCMQLYRNNNGDGCGALSTCDWVLPDKQVFDKLQNNYGFNLNIYYAAAAQCNKAKLEGNVPDYTTMQADGVTPACYYNIKAQKAKRTANCRGKDNLLCDYSFSFSDF